LTQEDEDNNNNNDITTWNQDKGYKQYVAGSDLPDYFAKTRQEPAWHVRSSSSSSLEEDLQQPEDEEVESILKPSVLEATRGTKHPKKKDQGTELKYEDDLHLQATNHGAQRLKKKLLHLFHSEDKSADINTNKRNVENKSSSKVPETKNNGGWLLKQKVLGLFHDKEKSSGGDKTMQQPKDTPTTASMKKTRSDASVGFDIDLEHETATVFSRPPEAVLKEDSTNSTTSVGLTQDGAKICVQADKPIVTQGSTTTTDLPQTSQTDQSGLRENDIALTKDMLCKLVSMKRGKSQSEQKLAFKGMLKKHFQIEKGTAMILPDGMIRKHVRADSTIDFATIPSDAWTKRALSRCTTIQLGCYLLSLFSTSA